MSCHDCLIWIDGPYKTVNQFIKEAQKRGCCRKVPFWPYWAKPGETRVFLAHRDGHRRTDRGSILGYFTLRGVDVLLAQDKCERYKVLLSDYKANPRAQNLEPLVDFWRDQFPGQGLPVTLPPKRKKKTKAPPPPYDDAVIDFILDFLISCEPNGGGRGLCGYGISTDQTCLEADRLCGSRPGNPATYLVGSRAANPAIYLVDGLAREIEWLFCQILKELIKKMLEEQETQDRQPKKRKRTYQAVMAELKRKASNRLVNGLLQGIPQFQEAVDQARATYRPGVKRPKGLAQISDRLGALVVFRKPYPSFRRLPQAAFRGLLRLESDELLQRIQAVYEPRSRTREIKLPYCKPSRPERKRKTQQELITDLAEKMQASKEFVGEFWKSCLDTISDELEERGRVTLASIGTLTVKKSRGAKQVKYKASDVLKRKVRR